MHESVKTPIQLDENLIIRTIEDNIIFTSFKNKLLEVSNMIGGKNQDRMEEAFLYGFDNLITQLRTEDELRDDRADQIFDLLNKLFFDNLNSHTFDYLLSSVNTENLAKHIFSEWQAALKGFRSNTTSKQTQLQ